MTGIEHGRQRAAARKAAAALLILFGVALFSPAQERGTIRGTVTDPQGNPIPGARIGVIEHKTAFMYQTSTDSSGRFRFQALDPKQLHRVVVSKFGFQAVTLDNVRADGNELRLSVAPEPGGPAPAEAPAASAEPAATAPTIKVAVSLVTLNVSVKDSAGVPVPNLEAGNFAVYDDGEPQKIVHFSEQSTPMSVVLLFDASSSMEGAPIAEARRAALEFVKQARPGDEIALVAFNDRIRTLQEFSLEKGAITRAIEHLTATGGTALYDALGEAVQMLASARYPRRFVVLFSDGIDADSLRKYDDVRKLVEGSDAVLFAVGEYTGSERELFMTGRQYYKEPKVEANYNPVWVLKSLADISGGQAYFPNAGEPLAPLYRAISSELQHMYVIAYNAPPPGNQPKFRTIKVTVNSPGAGPLTVRTRKGYRSGGGEELTRRN